MSNGDLSIVFYTEFGLEFTDKLYFSGCHTFQHCSNTFKLNKCAKCLSLSIKSESMLTELKSSLWMCGLLLQHHRLYFQPIASHFPQLLKCDTDYGSILLHSTLLAMLLYLASYEQ